MGLRVVVLGAAGVFGSRIAARLAHDERFELLLAGRREPPLEGVRTSIGDVRMRTCTLDTVSADFPAKLASASLRLSIRSFASGIAFTEGPYSIAAEKRNPPHGSRSAHRYIKAGAQHYRLRSPEQARRTKSDCYRRGRRGRRRSKCRLPQRGRRPSCPRHRPTSVHA